MGKKKNNTKTASETNEDIDDILADIDGKPAEKANSKKSKKNKKKENWEEEVSEELEKLSINNGEIQSNNQDVHENNDKQKKKKSKKNKKKNNDSDEEEEEQVIQSKMGGGFAALLQDDDDDDDEEDQDVPMDDDEDPEPQSQKSKPKQKEKKEDVSSTAAVVEEDKGKKSKKKKKGKKADDDDEEDLDKILAELEAEYQGGKPATPTEEKEDQEKSDPLKEDIEDATKAKKKKKKEAQKLRQQAEAEQVALQKKPAESATTPTPEPPSKEPTPAPAEAEEDGGDEDESSKKKKKKKKKKGEKDEEEEKGKKSQPNKKMLAAMKELLAKQKEEEERLAKIEEEKRLQEEERIRQAEEAKRLEEERKERKRQKEKERKERLKAEGKLLSNKQKQDQKRAQAMLEHLKAQGVDIPKIGEKPTRPGTRIRNKKNKQDSSKESSPQLEEVQQQVEEAQKEEQEKEQSPAESVETVEKEPEEELKDNWDEDSEEEEEETSTATKTSEESKPASSASKKKTIQEAEKSEEEEDDDDDESSSDDDSEHQTEAERKKARAVNRIEKRKLNNKKNVDSNILRSPVVCVLGHVDHGKTKILDKLRRTNVQEGEVGGITQQIGATNVPSEAIKNHCKLIRDFKMENIKFPGLLIIDTPGHESFSNLRTRGSSLCDIAILVVDITQGLEPQTIESINLLKAKKTPFIVALNKVDRCFEWESHPSKDIRDVIKLQNDPCKNDFDRRTKEIILAFNNQGLNAALFWENPDPRSFLSLVPTSAISGDGMGNLIAMICNSCQNRLSQRLIFNEELQCTVLEVKTIQGHGTTIDVILVNGRLREGDTVVLAGTEGPIVTQIRSLLLPKPMKEIRVKGQYDEFKEIQAAQGVKIAARDLEKAIAGLNLKVAYHDDEVELLKEQVDKEFSNAMKAIKLKDRGVYVQASTLGALEALLEFFKTNKVPYSGIRVGPVVKRDVMKAAAMLEHDPMYAVILAFDVKVERDAQDLADKEGVKIFSEETIYHLGDRYVEYLKDYKKKQQNEFKHIAVFPSRLKIIPTAIFNKRDPIVLGVTVEAGVLREGTPLCVPAKEFVEIGIVTSLEFDHKPVELARKGVDVCIKIEPTPGSTPKLFGRHFEATDQLVSKISRESINACKDYFRDDLSKTDWKLMAELKKEFSIL